MERLFDFDDILIEPANISNISSRKEINTLKDGMLPIFTAPMFDVVSKDNLEIFKEHKIIPIIPRSQCTLADSIEEWCAYSLAEFEHILANDMLQGTIEKPNKILIDIANGHMSKLIGAAGLAKRQRGESLILMVGNVANPVTYKILSDIGVDYVRIGIGNGGGCLTSQNTGIGYPMASLISECYLLAGQSLKPALIVADGGMKKYSDIIKALALGADYVMIGGILNKALESAAVTKNNSNIIIDQYSEEAKQNLHAGYELRKIFRGMSSRSVQAVINPDGKLKTSEGTTYTNIKVEYTLGTWTENFIDYLRSAMSYTSSIDLDAFIGKVGYNFITENALNRFRK